MEKLEKFKTFTIAKGMLEWARELNLGQAKYTTRATESCKEAEEADTIARNLKDMISSMDDNTRQSVFAAVTIITEQSEARMSGEKSLEPNEAMRHIELRQACNLLQNYRFLIEAQQKAAKRWCTARTTPTNP